MPKKMGYDEYLGNAFGKPDLERIGVFVDAAYMNGKGYTSPFPKPVYNHGATFLPSGRKTKTGTQHGYFDDEYKRLFENEGPPRKRPVGKSSKAPFLVGSRPKLHSTPGDYYGTFGGNIEAFGDRAKSRPKHTQEKINFLTRCGKFGGPGYADICFDKYPEHKPNPYGKPYMGKKYGAILDGPMKMPHFPTPYFDRNPYFESKVGPHYIKRPEKFIPNLFGNFLPNGPCKWQGGSHAGCFEPYPAFKPCKYVSSLQANKPFINDHEPTWQPPPTTYKSGYTKSILNEGVDRSVNINNCKTSEPTYIKHLVAPSQTIATRK